MKQSSIFRIFLRVPYEFLSFLGGIYRCIRYRNTYFFDTNFMITRESKIDNRSKKLYFLSKRFFITESIKKEVQELLRRPKFRKVNYSKCEEVSFNSLYSQDSRICPVYYNFIGTMHNPALLFTPDFILQLLFAKIIKKKSFTKEDDRIHMVLMDKLIKQAESRLNEGGTVKTEHEKVIDEAYIRSIRKRKDGLKGKNKNYPNDIRNLALVFIYSLIKKQNVTLITADSDALALFFDWTASLIQQISFNTKCLQELAKNDDEGMRALMQNKKKSFFFDAPELAKFINGTLQRYYSNHKKYFSPRLTIKYWDKERQKFFEVGINIDKYIRLLFLHSHCALNCPSAQNNIMGSFIKYLYWPPTPPHNNFVKILPLLKPIYKTSQQMPTDFHDLTCLYRRNDLSDNFEGFSSFLI